MCFDSLGSVCWFSTLDLQSGYWQIQVEEEDIPKTAFITKYGLYEYTHMPFGLCNAPSTFQRCMELVFRGLQWKTLLIYLDDIIILGRTMEENLDRLDEALERLQGANLKLKPSKCRLLQREVLFLGHIVSAAGVRPNPRLVESVREWEIPQDRKGVQQFLGLANYYRRFVPNFSGLARPLTDLTSKNKDYQWNEEAQQSFQFLKDALCAAPILAFPLADGKFVVDTDASNFSIGGVLSQSQDGEERVISYSSKKLDKQQQRYCVTRRELLAVVVFLREFRNHLLGRQFLIRTDHSSLTWLLNFKEPQGQLARWLEYIFQFDFHIEHREGKKHGNADALSRAPGDSGDCDAYRRGVPVDSLPCGGCSYCRKRQEDWVDFEEIDDVVPISSGIGRCRQVTTRGKASRGLSGTNPQRNGEPGPQLSMLASAPVSQPDEHVSTPEEEAVQLSPASWVQGYSSAELQDLQRHDPDLLPLHLWLDQGQKPSRDVAASLSPGTRSYWLNYENLQRVDGLLYLRWVDTAINQKVQLRLLVPRPLRAEVLKACHDFLFSGHLGVQKTVDRVKRRFHWPGLRQDVKIHIRTCPKCSANRMPYKKFRAALSNFRVGAPMDRVGIDLMGPLPASDKGNRYLLVIVDYFTRWAEAFALPDQRAETVAKTLVHEFVCRFGAPLELHSDQGRNFESQLFQEVCRLMNICKTRSSPYHPSSNGLVERFNRTLAGLIRSYLEKRLTDWDLYIPILTSAYRSTVHPSTGFSPNFLMLGREVSSPVDLLFPRPSEDDIKDIPEYVKEMLECLTECYDLARQQLKHAAENQKREHDTRIVQHKYSPGVLVYKRHHITKKLEVPWVGPYVVRKALNDCLYLVSNKKGSYVLHHDRLKPYTSSTVPSWATLMQTTV